MPCSNYEQNDSDRIASLSDRIASLLAENNSLKQQLYQSTGGKALLDDFGKLISVKDGIISDLKRKNHWLEAGLCALISELDKRGIATPVLLDANKNGMIDLIDFWHKHSQEDKARLTAKLSEFSEHERQLLKDLLNSEKKD